MSFVYGQPDPKSVVGIEHDTFTAFAARVCDKLGLNLSEVMSDRRDHRVVKTRQWLMAVARVELQWGCQRVGRFFHRDHTTVLHAATEIKTRIGIGDGGMWFDHVGRTCEEEFERLYKINFKNLFS